MNINYTFGNKQLYQTLTYKTSGSFGQITDGSYADKLAMQFYRKIKINMVFLQIFLMTP